MRMILERDGRTEGLRERPTGGREERKGRREKEKAFPMLL